MLITNRVTIKELAVQYNLKVDFLRTILCRSEFSQFIVSHGVFRNFEELHKRINDVIELKKRSKRCMLK